MGVTGRMPPPACPTLDTKPTPRHVLDAGGGGGVRRLRLHHRAARAKPPKAGLMALTGKQPPLASTARPASRILPHT